MPIVTVDAPSPWNAGHARKGNTPPVHMIRLIKEREIVLYIWTHPDDDDRRWRLPPIIVTRRQWVSRRGSLGRRKSGVADRLLEVAEIDVGLFNFGRRVINFGRWDWFGSIR
jgi:hypothetical protein